MPIGAAPAALRSDMDASVASAPKGAGKAPARDGFAMLADLARSALEAASEAMSAADAAAPPATDDHPVPEQTATEEQPQRGEALPIEAAPADAIDPVPAQIDTQEPTLVFDAPAATHEHGQHHFEIVNTDGIAAAHADWAIDSASGQLIPTAGASACAATQLTIRVTAPSGVSWLETVLAPARVAIVPSTPAAPTKPKTTSPRGLAHVLPPSALFAVDGAHRDSNASDPLDIEALGPVEYDMRAHMHIGDDGVFGLAPIAEPAETAETDIVLVDDLGLDAQIGPAPHSWSLNPGVLSERGPDRPAARARAGLVIIALDLRAPIATMPAIQTPAPIVIDEPLDLPELDGIPLDLDSALDDQPSPNFTIDWGRALATGDAR